MVENDKKKNSKTTVKATATKKSTQQKEVKKEVKEQEIENNNTKKDLVDSAKAKIDEIMTVDDDTSKYDNKDIEVNKAMAILAYIGPLALIPYLVEKDSKFVRYHALQGMNLFMVEIIFGVISYALKSLVQVSRMCELWGYKYECGTMTPWWITYPLNFIGIFLVALSIIGIVYICQGKAKEIPLINKFRVFK